MTYERSPLPEHTRVALRLADGFLTHPPAVTPGARADALATFSPTQIVELALKLVFGLVNKANIALGFDGPVDEEHATSFVYDEDGRFVLDGLGAVDKSTG